MGFDNIYRNSKKNVLNIRISITYMYNIKRFVNDLNLNYFFILQIAEFLPASDFIYNIFHSISYLCATNKNARVRREEVVYNQLRL